MEREITTPLIEFHKWIVHFFKTNLTHPLHKWRGITTPLIEFHKWIIHFFKTNSGHGSVAAIDLCVIRKREKLGLNAVY